MEENTKIKAAPSVGRTWTDEQQAAIDIRDRTLLVSAAAGSGKTATLTERIIRSVLDESAPVDISGMLIVTFTTAAVGELKERIEGALKKALENDPGNPRLERQLLMLPGARISTIDSFCSDILRANCERVGINPGYRIAEEAEGELIADNIFAELTESIYSGNEPEVMSPRELEDLSECLADVREADDFRLAIMKLYRDLQSTVKGVELIGQMAKDYSLGGKDFLCTPMGAYQKERLRELCRHYLDILADVPLRLELLYPGKRDNLKALINDDIYLLKSLLEGEDFDTVRGLLLNNPPGKTVGTAKLDPTLPPIGAVRRSMKEELAFFTEKVFFLRGEDMARASEGLCSAVDALYRFLRRFDEMFMQEKTARGICQFSDVLRYTHQCLWDGDRRTEVAVGQSELYDAIYIDEYQDVNELQDRIFLAISRDNNRFMVGDIKQSIYRFRSADPDIFARMKGELPRLIPPKPGQPYPPLTENAYSLFMSRNFRCDKGIIDFANGIFDRLFHCVKSSIGYSDGDRLRFAKNQQATSPVKPEVVLVDKAYTPAVRAEEGLESLRSATPLVVAKKIRELIDGGRLNNGEPIRPGDIAIIMRTMKGRDAQYAQALAYYGVPSVSAEEKSFFMNPEVIIVLCLLNAIDNPRKDVYLAGLMCSPLYGFDADELTLIRRLGDGECLYDSLRSYASQDLDGSEKARDFLKTLQGYRLLSEGMAVDELLIRLYHDTGLLSMATTSGKRRRLLSVWEHARGFESGSFRGLYNFISYLNGILDKKHDFDKRDTVDSEDAVRIITAHSSKGLEFPVVFYVEGDQPLSSPMEKRSRLIYDRDFGLGMDLRSSSGLALVKNPTREIVAEYRHRKNVEEDIRILYVILTRARERLYTVCTPGCAMKDFLKEAEYLHQYLDSYSVYHIKSYIELILAARGVDWISAEQFLGELPECMMQKEGEGREYAPELDEDDPEQYERIFDSIDEKTRVDTGGVSKEELIARFNYVYPHLSMTALPEKLSVSRLYPGVLDGSELTETEPDKLSFNKHAALSFKISGRRPRFMNEGDSATPTKRGIATHQLLQFADLENLRDGGVRRELDRLVEKKYLSPEDAALVRLDEVESFRNSALLRDMLRASAIWREHRFNVYLPASRFAEDEGLKAEYESRNARILVQGVIDCLYEDSDGKLHLVDYKTDRLSRAELASPELAEGKLRDAHREQLGYYAEAVESIFGRRPETVEVYSLHLGRCVDVSK